MAITQGFNNLQKKTLVGDLDHLNVSDDFPEYQNVLEIFKELTVEDAILHLDNMKNAINQAVVNEMKGRKLESLETLKKLEESDEE